VDIVLDAIGSTERRLSDAAEVDYLRNVDSPAVVDQDRWYYPPRIDAVTDGSFHSRRIL
jgi:hypothetical protein